VTLPHVRPAPLPLERVSFGLLLVFVALVHASIAASQIVLAAAVLGWAAVLVRDGTRPSAPAFFVPLLAFAAASVVSAAFSPEPLASFFNIKKLVLFAIVPLVYHLARGERSETVLTVIITVGAVSAALGIVQYGVLHYDNLGQRPRGTLSHYMTYSGLIMLVLCGAFGRVVFGARDRLWPALMLPALIVALSLTFTRSAWVGACAAVGLLLVLKDRRLVAVLPVAVALVFALAPDRITDRMVSMFDLKDPTNRDRVTMMRTG
jgi:O-antigen ligase